jgi:hypothetical protein
MGRIVALIGPVEVAVCEAPTTSSLASCEWGERIGQRRWSTLDRIAAAVLAHQQRR